MDEVKGMEFRTKMGIFWPESIYQLNKGKPIDPKSIVIHDMVKGIILPSTEGSVDGCTEIFVKKEQVARKVSELFSSDRAVRDGQGADMWKAARAHVQCKSKSLPVSTPGDVAAVALTIGESPSNKKKKKDDDDDLFDALWSDDLLINKGGSDHDHLPPPPKKPRASSASGRKPPSRKNPSLSAPPGTASTAVPESKRFKEISATEDIILKVEQMLRSLRCDKMYASTTVKAHQALQKKIDDRLVPGLLFIYTADYNPCASSSGSPGTELVEKAKAVQENTREDVGRMPRRIQVQRTGLDLCKGCCL